MHKTGKHVVPVCHQINIVSIVGAHVFERIGKFLSFGEELFKTTEATGHWPTPCVYNFGIGENQLNESNMTKVIGHLVYEKRCTSTMNPSLLNKFLAKFCQLRVR